MAEFKRAISYIKPYWRQVILNFSCNLLYVFSQFFSLALVAPFIGILFGMIEPVNENPGFGLNGDQILEWFYYYVTQIQDHFGTFRALLFVAGLFLFFSFWSNLFRYLGMRFLSPVRHGVVKDIRNDLYAKILVLPLSFFSEQRRGDLISRMTNDVGEIDWSVVKALQSLVKDPLNIVVFLVALIWISPQLMLIVVLILPLTFYVIQKIGGSLKRNTDKLQTKFGVMMSLLEEGISGLRMIKSYNIFDQSLSRFSDVHDDYTRYQTKIQRRIGLSSPLTEVLVVIAAVFVIWFGGDLVLSEKLSPEILILFIVLFFRLLPPAKDLAGAFFHLQKGRAALDRIYAVLDAEEKIEEAENPIEKKTFNQDIVYNNVSFSYQSDSENQVLNQISFKLKKGQTLAIVGPSGGGKSTLVDLLPRFYDCTSGDISIDNVLIKDIKLSDLRGLMGIVSQQSVLFNDTVFNNIAFGLEGAKKEDVIVAAQIANAHDFIIEMGGYEAHISDNGLNLSGGQRQRLNIARAVLRNPDILILDEATSALDTESEVMVQEALQRLMKGRTSLVIAHRLSTIQHADYILVLNKGHVVEEGSHTELLQQNGLYKRLVDMQTFG